MTSPAPTRQARPGVAVIGGGVSGLTAAYLLDRTHDVTLFEADDRLGGHAHTHDVTAADGSRHPVDSGFTVHNDRTYPWLRKLFAELGVAVRPTEMSMSIRCEQCGLEYAGGRGVKGLLAQRSRALDPKFLALLTQVRRGLLPVPLPRPARSALGDRLAHLVHRPGRFAYLVDKIEA